MRREEIEAFLEFADFWVWETDKELRLTYLSESFERITGLKRADYLGREPKHYGDADSNQVAIDRREKLMNERMPYREFKWPLAVADKEPLWLESNGAPFFDEAGTFAGYRGTGRDITAEVDEARENLEHQRENRMQQTLLSQIGKVSGVGAWSLRFADNKLEWSDETYDIYEIPHGTDVSLERALSAYDDEGQEKLQKAIESAQNNGSKFDVTVPFTTETGKSLWVRSMGLTDGGGTSRERIFGTFQDVTRERERHLEVEKIALRDSVTGIGNRHAFNAELENRLSSRALEDDRIILCMADLDKFKEVNDLYGHAVGDEVLGCVAQHLSQKAAPDGFVARIGGDEFGLIFSLPAGETEPQTFINERVADLENRFETSAGMLEVKLSLGFAIFKGPKAGSAGLMRDADFALHSAKAAGAGTIREYDPSMADAHHRRVIVAQQFQKAVANGSVVPHYQPIVELGTGKLSGLEALARWDHPTRGIIAPSLYMQVFEDNRICLELGELMLQRICADMEQWHKEGIFFGRVGYNVTASELKNPGFALNILSTLSKHGLQARHLVVEITETTMFEDADGIVRNQLKELRDAGVAIALDDFGTGYSSLTHLKTLPFNILKIDKTFVKDVMSSQTDKSIIKSFIDLGRDIGYTTVAEGIEMQAEVDYLRDLGCERGQGYLFQKPKSAQDIIEFLTGQDATGDRQQSIAV